MEKLPVVLTSTIVRTSQEGEVHGYLYLVDLETEEVLKTIEWNDPDISFQGRGGQRGLRGIAYYDNKIYVGSGFKILEFDQAFNLLNKYQNIYLDDIHEMEVVGDELAVVSSGYDAVVMFNLKSKTFTKAYAIDSLSMDYKKTYTYRFLNKYFIPPLFFNKDTKNYKLYVFDPNKEKQILGTSEKKNRIHINTVSFDGGDLCMSGTLSNFQFKIKNDKLYKNAVVPLVTHNVLNFDTDSILYNSTQNEEVILSKKNGIIKKRFKTLSFEINQLQNLPSDSRLAKAGWARGLCWTKNKKYIISGTSPASLMVFDSNTKQMLKSINLSKDIRNAIHGLEIYPY